MPPSDVTRPASRPSRPGAVPPSPPPANGAVPNVQPGASFESLRNTHEELVRKRGRLEGLQEQAQAQLAACQAEAAGMGVGSIEELEALIARKEAEDAAAMARFETDLKAEAELQARVEADLAAVES